VVEHHEKDGNCSQALDVGPKPPLAGLATDFTADPWRSDPGRSVSSRHFRSRRTLSRATTGLARGRPVPRIPVGRAA
jgi:hypothetical protein